MSSMYEGVEIKKLPDGPASKSYRRGYRFTGVCSGSKSGRRSDTMRDHWVSKTTTSKKPYQPKKPIVIKRGLTYKPDLRGK